MNLPDLLATSRGRLTAFFALYMTEGIPLGFTATAIATQMRREGLGPAEIGLFVGSLYLPWSWKWVAGPFVDTFASDRLGRRRMWIVGTQVLMVAALLAAIPINYTTELKLFTAVIFIHNCLCAIQDVAIDALAVNVVPEKERGLVNGFMFAGATLGQAVGGTIVLYMLSFAGMTASYLFVSAVILCVTVFIALPIREPKRLRPRPEGSPLEAAGKEVVRFVCDACRSMFLSRSALLGLVFAVLPAGPYALALALQSNLAVELGMSDLHVGHLSGVSTAVGAAGCIIGGWMSDKFGRRRMLALFVASMSLPTLYLAWVMQQHGWIMPVDVKLEERPEPAFTLLATFWGTTIVYNFFNGLMYGTRTALFMDITNRAVAATQFTAYMACLNSVIAYSAAWQGFAVEHWGYPTTLVIDSLIGLVGLGLLPWIVPIKDRPPSPAPDTAA